MGGLIAALALASCAFGSERALFSDSEAAFPFEDGAVFRWKPNLEPDDAVVRFVRVGDRYEIRRIDQTEERPMGVLFIAVPETPEDDYIAQVALDSENSEGFAYAFVWAVGDGEYRAFFQPSGLNENGDLAPERYCAPAAYGGCTFASAANVRAYFRNVLYPAISSGHIPARYLTLTPQDKL